VSYVSDPIRDHFVLEVASLTVLDDLKAVEQRLTARLEELRPALEEYRELEAAARRLGIDVDPAAGTATRSAAKPSSTRKPRMSGARRAAPTRAKRRAPARTKRAPRRAVQRRDQVLALIEARPGITVPDIGRELGVDPTGLYRVVRQLEAQGAIKKEGMALRLA
jgi:hypothetical protein